MELTAQAINAIRSLADQASIGDTTKEITLPYGGNIVNYLAKVDATPNGKEVGNILQPFRPPKLSVTTLTGFVNAVNAGIAGPVDDKDRIVHVEDHYTVSVQSKSSDNWGVRNKFLEAKYEPVSAFNFDTYYDNPALFIIGLQKSFLTTDNLLYLIRLASNLKAGNTVQVADDGLNQEVTIKTGEVSTADVRIEPRIKLIPHRTFREVNPVESEFLIRLKGSTGVPQIALFDLDGKKWHGEVMLAIKHYLQKHLTGATILA